MNEMNSLTHSCMHSFASLAILAFSGSAIFMIRATGAKLRILASDAVHEVDSLQCLELGDVKEPSDDMMSLNGPGTALALALARASKRRTCCKSWLQNVEAQRMREAA